MLREENIIYEKYKYFVLSIKKGEYELHRNGTMCSDGGILFTYKQGQEAKMLNLCIKLIEEFNVYPNRFTKLFKGKS